MFMYVPFYITCCEHVVSCDLLYAQVDHRSPIGCYLQGVGWYLTCTIWLVLLYIFFCSWFNAWRLHSPYMCASRHTHSHRPPPPYTALVAAPLQLTSLKTLLSRRTRPLPSGSLHIYFVATVTHVCTPSFALMWSLECMECFDLGLLKCTHPFYDIPSQ